MFLVATLIRNAAGAAVEMIQGTATSLEQSLDTALQGNYTAKHLVKDSALLWASNVQFITRLFSVGAPAERSVPNAGDDGPASADPRVSAPEA